MKMNTIETFLFLYVGHYFADFMCQSHWMAANKSKDNHALLSHCALYAIPMALFSLPPSIPAFLVLFWLWFIPHLMVDYHTSRISSRYFGVNWHVFFVVVGFDQLLHVWHIYLVTLFLTT